MVPLSTTLSDL